ncbi:MAG: hypothetical protein M1829_004270 [Trizodia sp. TS-e1964]|nr:MAG: hypothetical protein M1829_004270 [Trizodia sp. TS-e1964]
MEVSSPPQKPLEVLIAMVHLVLAQTGQVFQEKSLTNIKNLAPINMRMKEVITTASSRYQSALDEVEIEILRAKAVFQQNLTELRRKAEVNEKVIEGKGEDEELEEITMGESSAAAEEPILPQEDTATANPPAENAMDTQDTKTDNEDVSMLDGTVIAPLVEDRNKPVLDEAENGAASLKTSKLPHPLDLSESRLSKTAASEENVASSGASQDPPLTAISIPLITPLTAGLKSYEFDSMFDLAGDDGADHEFGVEFAEHGSGFADIASANAMPLIGAASGKEDVASLLPEAEAYPSTLDDLSDIPVLIDPLPQQKLEPQQMGDGTAAVSGNLNISNSLDELFFDPDFDFGEELEDLDEPSTIGGAAGDIDEIFGGINH